MNLTNFQQFINIFPIKIFHLFSYLLLMNLWRSGSTRNKVISLRRLLYKITISKASSKALYHTTQLSHALTMTMNSCHDSQFHALVNHHTGTRGNQSMHMPRWDITCLSPCSCSYPKRRG